MNPLLSICIPTFNRAKFLPETLHSILNQSMGSVEIVIVDGGSTDNTKEVVQSFFLKNPCVRYILSPYAGDSSVPSNAGFDRDCDYAVRSSRGQYCWLMTDDDVLVPNAIETIIEKIRNDFDVIVTATQVKDISLSRILLAKRSSVSADRTFAVEEFDNFFSCAANCMTFVGCIVIRRNNWVDQDTSRYFGTGFIHIAVIFNRPPTYPMLVLSNPLVIIRYSNALWSDRAFQIMMLSWPQLIWSLSSVNDKFKALVVHREPWSSIKPLIRLRALSAYNYSTYEKHLQSKPMSSLRRILTYGIAVMPYSIARFVTKIVALKRSWINADQLLLQDMIDSKMRTKHRTSSN